MSEGRAFLDTNVLVYAFDASAGYRHEVARTLLEAAFSSSRGHWVSVQVLREFYVVVTRKVATPLSQDEAEDIVRDPCFLPVVEETADIVMAGLAIHRRHGLSPWDGLIVAAAAAVGCETLLSEDLNHGQVIEGVRVVNPFLAGEVPSP
jgi:predicted nucleic acid-binding protein